MGESYVNRPMSDFIADAASDKPTPGGGAVAAMAGALASTMASMAANFTAGREKYAHVEEKMQTALKTLDANRSRLLSLMEADIAGYAKVGAAYGLPRKSPEEKAARKIAIQAALKDAMIPPSQTADCCNEILTVCADLAEACNPNLLSDVGVAAVLAEAALRAGQINVRVNLALIKDKPFVAIEREKLASDGRTAAELAARVAAAIDEKM